MKPSEEPLERSKQQGAVPGPWAGGGGSREEDVVSGSGALGGPRKLRTELGPHEPGRARGWSGGRTRLRSQTGRWA